MSSGLENAATLRLGFEFRAKSKGKESNAQRGIYVSVRLSAAEKAQLDSDAAGASLSAYVRDRLFDGSKRAKATYSIADRQALARVLRVLAESNLALDLEAVCAAAEEQSLPVEPLLTTQLKAACADVAAMRKDLIRALGLRPK